jgi:hypothetical protein
VVGAVPGYGPSMTERPDADRHGPELDPADLDRLSATRAQPLPEERAVEDGGEDRREEAAAILRDSEERVAGATAGDAPAEGADEHRRSEETAGG